ncbi:MAG: YjgP/YjgQ family permease [Bacteroidetes bacterium]|nr:MAG: YjgP/YjgQ family permease [Bacteroidota bacterium]
MFKRLYIFSIRSFTGPFIITFCISMFMLIMQFLWKYIDDLIGKGIDFLVILELFMYVSATLIPLALPLAMLLSSIMTMGNLAENNELTALKSAGLSLFRILKPLTVIVVILGFCTFLFANFVIPVANLKWRALIYDIQETKIATILTPGTYSSVLDGYSIKISEGNDQEFKDIVIHDHSSPNVIKTVKAKSGEVYKSESGNYLYFNLNQGEVIEELFVNNRSEMFRSGSFYPGRRSSFKQASYKIDIRGFTMSRSNEKLFENQYEMWNVFQISKAMDSIQRNARKIRNNFLLSLKNEHAYLRTKSLNGITERNMHLPDSLAPKEAIDVASINDLDKIRAYESAVSKIRRVNQNLDGQKEFMKTFEKSIRQFEIEFHRKLALPVAIVVLFFIGAPLGAIVRKGGFGAPVVIAALLFLVYYVITELGSNLAESGTLSPVLGVWLATFVLAPVAFILLRSAAMDSRVFDKETWKKMFKFGSK